MKNTLPFTYSTSILVRLLTVNIYKRTVINPKMCDPILVTLLKMQPHYSQSSRENATPSSGTSQLASYKEVPPPPPDLAQLQLQKGMFNQHFPKLNQLTWLSALCQDSGQRKNISCKSNFILRLSWYQNRKKNSVWNKTKCTVCRAQRHIEMTWHDKVRKTVSFFRSVENSISVSIFCGIMLYLFTVTQIKWS